MSAQDQLSLTFAALADPTRRAILARLARGEATVNELAAPLSISLPAVSRHLKVLERAGLITRGRVAQSRPCRLQPAGLEAAGQWLRGTREDWEASMDRLEELFRNARRPAQLREQDDPTRGVAMSTTQTAPTTEHELVLERVFDATPDRVFRAWTDPEVLKKWFAPKPFTTPSAVMDVRPGGASTIVMRGPDGTEYPNTGVYLEVVPNRRLVSTDAYVSAWVPSERPFMTMDLSFEDIGGGKTKATYRIKHWTAEAKKQHEDMGFYDGWGQVADQLAELLARGEA